MPESRLERTRNAYEELIQDSGEVSIFPSSICLDAWPVIPWPLSPEQLDVIEKWRKEFDELRERGKIATPSA